MNIKFYVFGFLSALLVSNECFAQSYTVEWENTIGGNWGDGCNAMTATTDGGFVLGGGSSSDVFGDKTEANIGQGDVWLVKINGAGDVVWDETIGGTENENLLSLEETTDGGLILGVISNSGISGDKTEGNNGGYDYWVIKTDAIGNIQWQNTIGGNGHDEIKQVYEASDGGFVVAGYSNSGVSGDKTEQNYGGSNGDLWIVKLNASGAIVWQNTIGGTSNDYLLAARPGTNGSIYLAANSDSDIGIDKTENSIGGTSDYWLIKLNNQGNIEWQNTIGGDDADDMSDLVVTDDEGALLIGVSRSGISDDKTEANIGMNDFWIVKVDNQGQVEWDETIGGTDTDDPYEVQETANGYLISGFSKSGISGDKTEPSYGEWDFWVIEINNEGGIIWQKTVGGNANDICYSMETVGSNSVVLAGASSSGISGDKTEANIGNGDYWVLKLADQTITAVETNRLDLPSSWMVDLFDISGKLLYSGLERSTTSTLIQHLVPPGTYIKKYTEVETGRTLFTEKLLIHQ